MGLMAIPENLIIEGQKVTPEQAVKDFESKGLEVTATQAETAEAVQKRLFAVTRSVKLDILQDFKDEIGKAIKEGTSFKTFQEEITNKLSAKGWTGKRSLKLPTGEIIKVQTTPYRLRTIFDTNIQNSLNAGRYERQLANQSSRPYLQLIEILDPSTRHNHRRQSGSIALLGAQFWKVWYPSNGFNCRGRTRALTESQAKSRGIGVKVPGLLPDKGFRNNPAVTPFTPKKEDYDSDIWEAVK